MNAQRPWMGPRTPCSLCGVLRPAVKVPPRASGAVAVTGYFCPTCDSVAQQDKKGKH